MLKTFESLCSLVTTESMMKEKAWTFSFSDVLRQRIVKVRFVAI